MSQVHAVTANPTRRLYVGLLLLSLLAVAVVLVSSVMSLRTTSRLAESIASVSQTQRALEQINRSWGVLGDRDTQVLRYLLTGSEGNLAQFRRMLVEMDQASDQLRVLVGEHPGQRARLDQLDALNQERVLRANQLIALKQRALAGDASAQAVLDREFDQSPGTGNAEAMRRLLDSMADAEKAVLAERSRQRTAMIRQNRNTVLVANGLALLAGIAVLLALRRLGRRADEAWRAQLADLEKSAMLATQQQLARERQLGLDLIAHDLRQHFGNLLFGLDLLKSADSAQDRERLVRTAQGAANSGLLFLEAVLEQSAGEARGEAPGPVPLAPLVHEAIAGQAHLAQGKQMRFEVRLDPALRVRVQPSVVGHVLSNLVSNAVKYAPAGSVIELELIRHEARAQLRVLDRGPGVPVNEQSALFRRFAPLSPRPSGGELATGLGLALARQRTRAQGGELRYADRPGGGACFILEWPLA